MFTQKLFDSLNKYSKNAAFCIKGEYFTYEDLSKSISLVQNSFSRWAIKNSTIGLVTNDDIFTYSTILACWLSGISYVPISPKNPIDRNASVLKSAGSLFVFSSENSDIDWAELGFGFVNTSEIENESPTLSCVSVSAETFAYILFTSGSTGVPKGVPITYGNIDAFVQSFNALGYNINEKDHCLQMFELTFDVSVASLLMPLLDGACVYTLPGEVVKYLHIVKLLKAFPITIITIVPSVINLLKPFLTQLKFESVRLCILTAEATFVDLLTLWAPVVPNAAIWNLYGPTEATIWCTGYKYDPINPVNYNGMFAIGSPLKEVDFLIVDDSFNEVGQNQKGQLVISGGHITPGYLNDPEKNKAAFVNIVKGGETLRFYKTGDLCFVDHIGIINYCGRIDNQVQIQGFRVELSEIEVTVRDRFNLNNVVVCRNNKLGSAELILVLEKSKIDHDVISEHIKTKLPYYMIPSQIKNLDEFPLNSSGKIDRKKILENL